MDNRPLLRCFFLKVSGLVGRYGYCHPILSVPLLQLFVRLIAYAVVTVSVLPCTDPELIGYVILACRTMNFGCSVCRLRSRASEPIDRTSLDSTVVPGYQASNL